MLTVGNYRLEELKVYFRTRNKQNTDRKLKTYKVKYTIEPGQRRARNPLYHIKEIKNPLRLYCIFDLGLQPNTDTDKFCDFLFFLFTDPDFRWKPTEMMEEYTRSIGRDISRQTISNYIDILEQLGYFYKYGEFVYYMVYKEAGVQKHEIITKEQYSTAWKIYWACREEGYKSSPAFATMYREFGGVPRKQQKIIGNGIYNKELETLENLVYDNYMARSGSQE